MKKKIIATVLAASTLFTFAACSSTPKWHEEAKNAVADKFEGADCGEFYLEGDVYHLPCKVSEFLDNGWEFDSNTETELKAHEKSEKYWYMSKDNKQIALGYTNNTNETLKVEDTEVDYIELGLKSGRVATAGDLELFYQKFDDADAFFDFLGIKEEDCLVEKVGSSATEYTYFYNNADNYDSCVTFKLAEDKEKYSVDEITYACDYYYDVAFEVEAVVNGVINDDPSSLDPILTMIINDSENSDFDAATYVYDERADLADFLIYNLGFDITFYDMSDADQKVWMDFLQSVFDKIEYEVSYDESTNDVTIVYKTADIVTPMIVAYNDACATYEGELDEDTWFIDEAFLSHYVNSVDPNYELEMLPEATYVINNDADHFYYAILVNLIGLGDYISY